jgi:poly-beta-1,6-N-acetyl-D-glucosamine synthase
MTIIVTVGVCVRNCANDIKQIVDSVYAQDFPHEKMEVIFVDDGSADGTLSSIFKYAFQLDTTYKVYHHKWKGLGFSRNVVLKNAHGKYVVWVDDGTILSENYISEHVRFMESHPTVGISKGVFGVYNGANRVATLENMITLAFNYEHRGKYTAKLPGTAGSVYRVKTAKQIGGFDEKLKGATEDMDIAYRILSAGWKIYKTQITFQIIYNQKFMEVWKKNFWYGYGSHSTLHKHKELSEILYKSTPFAGFIEGLLVSINAYKLTRKKIAFLLPIYFFIKRTAFCLGFIKSHLDSHKRKKILSAK